MVVLTVPSLERVRWARFSVPPVAYCELRFWYAAMVETTFRADAGESAAGERVSGGQRNAVSFAGRNADADPTQQRIGVGTAAETKKIDGSGSAGSLQVREQCGVRRMKKRMKKKR
jgi:hypothetical protein